MNKMFLRSLKLTNFLSFGPDSKEIELTPLNVLIGPNASGKSNFIEAIELLHATPTNLAEAIRIGGTAEEWLWKGTSPAQPAIIKARLWSATAAQELSYSLTFTEARSHIEIVGESLEIAPRRRRQTDSVSHFFYRNEVTGSRVISVKEKVNDKESKRAYVVLPIARESLNAEQSIFTQRKDPDLYPDLTHVAEQFGRIQIYREWSFGRAAALRQAQPASLPADALLPNLVNLGHVLNDLEHQDSWPRFLELMQRFLPRFKRLTTKIQGGSVQIYLHEDGLKTPVPATRLSDGTIRFLALMAVLLHPGNAPVLCIEEPELGLHPDALAILAELLVEAKKKTQVVVTTHSDVLVSALSEHPDSVLVCDYVGGTEFRRLEPAKLQHWLEQYRLGEIWRMGKLGGNI
ncbi:MAG: AAA family ATPase [Verrucomicrobiota bacterium]